MDAAAKHKRAADAIAMMAEAFAEAGLSPPILIMASWEDQMVFAAHVAELPLFGDRAPSLLINGVIVDSPSRVRPRYTSQ